jgi:hypothetical protein
MNELGWGGRSEKRRVAFFYGSVPSMYRRRASRLRSKSIPLLAGLSWSAGSYALANRGTIPVRSKAGLGTGRLPVRPSTRPWRRTGSRISGGSDQMSDCF